ncbi:MAG: hypothetical protein M3Y75_02230 [Actinomycetota bacterium]|nr:hypothetical protein [Actinomycetota bacterium]
MAGKTVTLRKATLLVLLVLAALGGCGGGDDETVATSNPVATGPADPAYVRKANAICRKALAQTRRLGRSFLTSSETTPASSDLLTLTTEKLVRPGIAIRAQMARELRRLPPPERGRESVEAYIELFDPLEELSRLRLRAGVEHDLDQANRAESLMRELAEEQEAAARLAGLQVCATDFVTTAFGQPSGN